MTSYQISDSTRDVGEIIHSSCENQYRSMFANLQSISATSQDGGVTFPQTSPSGTIHNMSATCQTQEQLIKRGGESIVRIKCKSMTPT